MVDRQMFRDLALAILLALPLAALTKSQPLPHHQISAPHAARVAIADPAQGGRISLLS
jgi:hypothetical protein